MPDETKGDRVLIVDDTPRNIQVLGTILKDQGYQINVAQNGLQALDVVTKVTPDIILLDVMMPELDGFETCKRLKENPDTAEIPVVFLTAKVETEDVVHGFELGAVDYVTKPFNPTELLVRVDTHLTLYKLKRNLEQLVEERTEELQFAHAQLQQYVKELEVRDRLTQLQMKSPTFDEAYEAILIAINDAVAPTATTIFTTDDAGSTLVSAADLGDGSAHIGEAHTPSPPAEGDPAAEAFAQQSPVSKDDHAAVPILCDEVTLGAVTVTGLSATASSRSIDKTALLDALWRIVSDGAVVLHNAQLAADLESGDLNVDDLLNVDI